MKSCCSSSTTAIAAGRCACRTRRFATTAFPTRGRARASSCAASPTSSDKPRRPNVSARSVQPIRMIAFLEAHRAGLFKRAQLWPNVVAGVIVGIVALPLAMAFAIASGAKPEQGLYTAIVAGLATSLLGGTRVQISGPTGAFIAVLAGITAQYGIDGLQVATLMAGCILLAMGVAQLGGVIKFIPNPVIVGFTSGIAVIIWVGQWKDFFGLHPQASSAHFHERVWTLLQALPQFDPATTAIAVASLVIVVVGNRVLERIPGLRRVPAPLVAMLVATAVQAWFAFPGVATIGSAFGGIPRVLP